MMRSLGVNMIMKKIIISIIVLLSFLTCSKNDSIIGSSDLNQIKIEFLKYWPDSSCSFLIQNNTIFNIESVGNFHFRVIRDSTWTAYDMSPYYGNNQPLLFRIKANETMKLGIGLYPPNENMWKLGILFKVLNLSDSVLVWSDPVRISN